MLLAVDIGNTNTKFGLFENSDLVAKSTISTGGIIEGSALPAGVSFRGDIDNIVVCSVVPNAAAVLQTALTGTYSIKPQFIGRDLKVPLESKYQPADSIGTDRLVNSWAARTIYGEPCMVCSFGSATTFDAVDAKGIHAGGAIAPGARMGARALHEFTARLPMIEPAVGYLLGNTTDEAIRSGVFWGQIAMAEGMISRFKVEIGSKAVVVATGGFADRVAEHTAMFDHVDPDLTLKGIRLVHAAAQPA
jgi:type III pantothenate kinase